MFMGGAAAASAIAGEPPPVQIEHTLVAANLDGVTIGYLDKAGGPGGGTFTPRESAGVEIIRMTYGGTISTVSFGMLGSFFPDNNSSWRQIRAIGTFQGGFNTKIFVRANAEFYIPDNDNETAWGFGPVTDGFIIGNTYSIFIDDRIG